MGQQEEVELANYAVCLIDILGTRDRLATWRELPMDGVPRAEHIQALQNTVGVVLRFRDMFDKYFNAFAEPTLPSLLSQLPSEQQELYWRFKQCRLSVEQFSDTFVFYAPIPNAFGDVSVVQLYRMLTACAMAMIVSLAERVAFRGAITLGLGLELEERNFYGPPLAEAHSLESRRAGYPRVLVSPDACEFLGEVAKSTSTRLIDGAMRQVAQICLSLLVKDGDGKSILDFMGRGMWELWHPDNAVSKGIRAAYQFVCDEETRFGQEGNDKLHARYASLRGYMESRLPLWAS